VTLPRLLALMGSGETSPTMVKTHRDLLGRVGASAPAVLLDTPFGFQANAADLTARAQGYFKESVGASLGVATFRSSDEIGSVEYEHTLSLLRSAGYVFAGPGSPTYALAQWRDSAIPGVLRSKLVDGGCVVFASAAALTMGVVTVPVYEIYKVGAPPVWVEGLDLLAEAGLRAAVIPHYNNAEGGNHDTRFCYLGEPRLSLLEATLPDDAFVLGIDEHTGLVLDLDAGTATVVGNACATIRASGRSEELESGTTVPTADLASMAEDLRADPTTSTGRVARTEGPGRGGSREAGGTPAGRIREGQDPPGAGTPPATPLREAIDAHASAFDAAMTDRDVDAAAQAVLDLEAELHAWSADPTQSDDVDHGRSTLRSMVARLASVAATGARDPRDVVGPFVDAMLDLRTQARSERRFTDADAVRDALVGLGVEVRDGPAGTDWDLGRG
jgi:hypothetical protein